MSAYPISTVATHQELIGSDNLPLRRSNSHWRGSAGKKGCTDNISAGYSEKSQSGSFWQDIKIDCIWDEGLKGTEVIAERKTNSQLEHGVASFPVSHTGDGEREKRQVKEMERKGERGTSGVRWRPRRFPAVEVSQLLPRPSPCQRADHGNDFVEIVRSQCGNTTDVSARFHPGCRGGGDTDMQGSRLEAVGWVHGIQRERLAQMEPQTHSMSAALFKRAPGIPAAFGRHEHFVF
ncbi:unnamed protein product [Pleuronectes platessa]|uniref:Uncharacterized protein n=1 Tax=Pleuronectes platessa TaxID=8262 RepID=A0A9N7UMZ7_PLEPL|nr:unnamed protein product [Pleuronectes platessa]